MNEKAFFLNKTKTNAKISSNKKSSPIKSYSGNRNKDSPPLAGKKLKNPQASQQYMKTYLTPTFESSKHSLFPKLNMNQAKRKENEKVNLNYLPPISIKSQVPPQKPNLEEGEEAIFQLPDEEDYSDSIPSGLVIQQSSETEEKIDKIDPFQPILMDESTAFMTNYQVPDSVPTSGFESPMQSPNSLYNSDNYYPDTNYIEEEDEYIPPPSPKYGSVMVQAGENPSFTLTLPLDQIKPEIPEDGSLPELPPRLAAIVGNNKTAISYLALCGVPVNGYQPKLLRKAIKELKGYEEQCISYGFTAEARYVNDTLKLVKADLKDRLSTGDVTGIFEIEEKIFSIDSEINQKEEAFKNAVAKMNAEKDIAIKSLQVECDIDCDEIDKEWTSPEKAKEFSKGSKRLSDMRFEAAALLAAKRFEEASNLSKRADILAEKETKIVQRSMMRKYAKTLQDRRNKCNLDSKALNDSYEKKFILMERKKEQVENILHKRKEKLIAKRSDLVTRNTLKEKHNMKQAEINANAPIYRKAKDVSVRTNYGLNLQPLSKLSRKSALKHIRDIV